MLGRILLMSVPFNDLILLFSSSQPGEGDCLWMKKLSEPGNLLPHSRYLIFYVLGEDFFFFFVYRGGFLFYLSVRVIPHLVVNIRVQLKRLNDLF